MKKIVVGIDGSRNSFDSYKCAATLFKDEDIALTALFVRDERKTQIPFIYSGAAYDIAYERLYIPVDPQLQNIFKKINEDNKIFAEKCLKMCKNIKIGNNVEYNGTVLEGDPSEVLMNYTKDSDLLVLGQRGENAEYAKELIGSVSEDLIRKSLIPVLICPGDYIKTDRILIVYEQSTSSKNALDFYINELSRENRELTILMKGHLDETSTSIDKKINNLKKDGKEITVEHCNGSLSHRALEIMETGIIDMFVLGSHGTHKLTEYLLGSVTVHIIRKSSLPVFIVH